MLSIITDIRRPYLYLVWRREDITKKYLGKRNPPKYTADEDFGRMYFTSSAIIQKEFHKYPERFQWRILFTGSREEIDSYELALIWENREYLPLNLNYMGTPTFKGHKHSIEAKRKIAEAARQIGTKRQSQGLARFSFAARQRMKQANIDKRGKYPSPQAGTGGVVYTCDRCGQKFKAGPASERKYCSQNCYEASRPKSKLKRESKCPVC